MSGVAQAAGPFWRNAGMTYLSYANTCAIVVRNCLKEPFKTQAATREHAYYKVQTYVDGVAQKAGAGQYLSNFLSVYVYIVLACVVYAVILLWYPCF